MTDSQEFSDEQKQYLQGFLSGAALLRPSTSSVQNTAALSDSALSDSATAPSLNSAQTPAESVKRKAFGPDAAGLRAQDRVLDAGGKLNEQEAARRNKNPLDQWDDIVLHSAQKRFPKGQDVLAFKSWGLFYTSPAQDAYMSRLRFAGGLMRADQMRCVAKITRDFSGGYAHVTTRGNLQIREIRAEHGAEVVMLLHDYGIVNKGSGADNIRNVTGSPTAGIDAQEIYDTRALCREMNHYILSNREMYGLPRKFNVAFDGGGSVSTLEETNDIGFAAVQIRDEFASAEHASEKFPENIGFRLMLGGITGHQDFARDTGILLRADQCVAIAAAIIRVFIDEGDRTDRKKARLKYVLDRLGFDAFLEKVRAYLDFEPARVPLENCVPRRVLDRLAHVGIHAQKQAGLFYVGVVLPVGKLEAAQMFALSDLADKYGSGTIRLTAWQNLILSDVRAENLEALKAEIVAIGLNWNASNVRAGIVACTGNFGCKFALANTKSSAMEIAAYVEERLQLDTPLNIHVTGCPHSCAQHYIGDIGLLGAKVEVGDDLHDGYHIFVGGGYGANAAIGRPIYQEILANDAPRVIENMLATYLENHDDSETFVQWTKRHSEAEMRALFDQNAAVLV